MISLVILFLSFHGCSDKNPGIDISLQENEQLEDIAAGWWIKELGLHYGAQSKYITIQIHDYLHEKARLLDKYQADDGALTAIWEYDGKTTQIVIEEKIYQSSDGQNIWMTYEYPSPGTTWSNIIPSDYTRLKPDRKYEHAVTIHSVADGKARLFLFGGGEYCRRISLF